MRMRGYLMLATYFTCGAVSGVFCQSFSPPTDEICPGGDVTFTCVAVDDDGTRSTRWTVTPGGGDDTCFVPHMDPVPDSCGPSNSFTASFTGRSGDQYSSTLSVAAISDSLNGTTVQCTDPTVYTIGSDDICIIGGVLVPQFLAPTVSERSVGADECVLSVRWSEAVISCGGSVSQYVLSVTPPTPDCPSGQCVTTTDTQYNLTVTVDQTYSLNVTAFDSCGNNQAGENSMTLVELTGSIASCTAEYRFSPHDGSLQSEDITWTQVHLSPFGEAEYSVIIDAGVGPALRERVSSPDCNSTHCSYSYHPPANSSAEFGVSVEATGCVTRQTVCTEKPIHCSVDDLGPSLEELNRLCKSVSGGMVCYSGYSVGAVAVYSCNHNHSLQGDSTRQCLPTGYWSGATPQCIPDTESSCSSDTTCETTAAITGVVCSIVFLSVGVLLGAVCVYLILRARGKPSGPTSLPPPPLPPAVTYEEVGVSGEASSSAHNIQLSSNEAYAPLHKDNIPTSRNTAYGQVQL